MTTHTQEQVLAAINLFVALLTEEHAKHYAEKFPRNLVPVPRASIGTKYAKIMLQEMRDGKLKDCSVYCFIDLSNGDILKAAGCNAPAKGKRGSIFNEDCDVGTRATVYGSGLYR